MDFDQAGGDPGSRPGTVTAAPAARRLGRAHAEFTRLNKKYVRYCMIGLIISGAIHAGFILLSAGPTPKPYQLRDRKIEVIDIPDEIDVAGEIDIPPPAAEVEQPVPATLHAPVTTDIPKSQKSQKTVQKSTQETIPEAIPESIEGSASPGPTLDPSSPPVVQPFPSGAQSEFLAFDAPPELIRAVKPEYPPLAKEAHAEGVVHVQVTIDETGRVIEAEVIGSNTIKLLDDAAIEAAKQSLFRPAKQRDVPVKSRITIPFRFKLN